MSASEITRILPRAWRARDASDPAPGREARRSSSRASRAVAIALLPCAKGRERRVEIRVQTEPVGMWRSWMISVPTDDAARSCDRCNGSAASGNAASRPYMRPSQSSAVHETATRCEAAQIAQGQRQQPASPKRGRQRRQQAKRKRRGAAARDDRQREVVKLLRCRSSSGSRARAAARNRLSWR